MKKNKTTSVKKLTLNKETVARLQQATAGLYKVDEPASGGPDICWFSDCNPCD